MNSNDNQFLKVICISDTHSYIYPNLPQGDILIHAGDLTQSGSDKEIEQFIDWLECQKFKHKIVIPGNHDLAFDAEYNNKRNLVRNENYDPKPRINQMKSKCYFLLDEEITIEGYKFYGSPYSLEWWHGAFQLNQFDAKQKWQKIPQNTDIVITHGPPYSYGDFADQKHVGDKELLKRVNEIKPIYHIFGHIHEGYGKFEDENGTTFINCAQLDGYYKSRQFIEFQLEKKQM